MAKYIVVGTYSSFHTNWDGKIGHKHISSHVRDTVENSIKHFFSYEEKMEHPLDPLEFMLKLNDYTLYTLSDNYIILSIMGLGDYVEQGGSLGDQHE